jgi:hypothetical protein
MNGTWWRFSFDCGNERGIESLKGTECSFKKKGATADGLTIDHRQNWENTQRKGNYTVWEVCISGCDEDEFSEWNVFQQ